MLGKFAKCNFVSVITTRVTSSELKKKYKNIFETSNYFVEKRNKKKEKEKDEIYS